MYWAQLAWDRNHLTTLSTALKTARGHYDFLLDLMASSFNTGLIHYTTRQGHLNVYPEWGFHPARQKLLGQRAEWVSIVGNTASEMFLTGKSGESREKCRITDFFTFKIVGQKSRTKTIKWFHEVAPKEDNFWRTGRKWSNVHFGITLRVMRRNTNRIFHKHTLYCFIFVCFFFISTNWCPEMWN